MTRIRVATTACVVAAGVMVGLVFQAAANGAPSDLPYPNPGPRGPETPFFTPNEQPPVTPPGLDQGQANMLFDASYLSFISARVGGDEMICGIGCPLPATTDNLDYWFGRACDRFQLSRAFTEGLTETAPAAFAELAEVANRVCDSGAALKDVLGPPNPSEERWSHFGENAHQDLDRVIAKAQSEAP